MRQQRPEDHPNRPSGRRRAPSSGPTKTARLGRSTSAPVSGIARWLRPLLAWLRGTAITLALISGISFVPVSVSSDWPESGQRALVIAREVRALLVDVGGELLHEGADWLSHTGTELAKDAGQLLSDALQGASDLDLDLDLEFQLPGLGDLLPDPKALFGDLLGGLIDDWWPQPTLPAGGGDLPHVAGSFAHAKDLLYDRVYRGHRITSYCGCTYNRRRKVDLGSCGLERYSSNERARRVEAEHVFPAAQFGNVRRCWRQPKAFRACREANGKSLSGRECCLRVDETFVAAHNDLQNLIPAVGMINAERSDYSWGMAPDGERFGDCKIRIDARGRRVQPPDALRGDIARIMLYMSDVYGFQLSAQDERLFRAWNNIDPPDAWELKRQRRIARLQGMQNRYVTE